jgi:hypothetical protein
LSGSLDGARQFSLVFSACSGLPPWSNFTIICYETPQCLCLLVINHCAFIDTELAFSRASEETPHTRLCFIICRMVTHFIYSSKYLLNQFVLVISFESRRVHVFFSIIQHDHLIGYDLGSRMFVSFLVLPMASLQATFYVNQAIFKEILFTDFSQVAPGNHIEPLGLRPMLTI